MFWRGNGLDDLATGALASVQIELVDLHFDGREFEELVGPGLFVPPVSRQRLSASATGVWEEGCARCELFRWGEVPVEPRRQLLHQRFQRSGPLLGLFQALMKGSLS